MYADFEIEDVPRGCGNLVPGGYYLSSVDCAIATGELQLVTFPFGDGLTEVVACGDAVPKRGMLLINPAATFATKSVVRVEAPPIGGELYGSLAKRVLTEGLVDHVGSRHYTAASFAMELFERMPNRRVHQDVARKLADKLPLPVVFTHSQMPWFRGNDEIEQALDYCRQLINGDNTWYIGANWLRDGWGVFEKQDDGRDHFMMPILGIMDRLQREWQQLHAIPWWQEVKAFFDGLQYEEQPFAISWFVRAIRIVDDEHQMTQGDADAGILAARAVQPNEGADAA